jgi:hypothetical protein
MASAELGDKFSELDKIVGRFRKKRVAPSPVLLSMRLLEVALVLATLSWVGYQYLYDLSPMSQPQGTILRTLVEKVAALHDEPISRVWEGIRGNLGIPRDTFMSRQQWTTAVRALAAEIDRH